MIGDLWTAKQLTTVYLEMFSSSEDLLLLPLWFVTFYKAWLLLNRPDRYTGYFVQCSVLLNVCHGPNLRSIGVVV